MRKIRDFIYNTSDILVVLLIIVLALGIIGWRVDIIMTESGGDEDSGLFHSIAVKVVDTVEDLTGKDFAFNDAAHEDDADVNDEDTDQPDVSGDDQQDQEQDPPTPPSSFILIVSEGDNAEDIAQKLASTGAITDTQYFVNLISTSGKPINPGAYTILTGLTPEEILNEITG